MLRNKFNVESFFSRLPPAVSWIATGVVVLAPLSLAFTYGPVPPESKNQVEDAQNTIEVHIEEFMFPEKPEDISPESLSKISESPKPSETLEL